MQVSGRIANGAAESLSLRYGAGEGIGATQKTACLRHVANFEGLPDFGGGNAHCIDVLAGYLFDCEAETAGVGLQEFEITLAVPAEVVVVADHQLFGVQGVEQDLLHVFLGREEGELFRERDDEQVIEVEFTEFGYPLFDGGEQAELVRVLGRKNEPGVRPVSNHHALPT